MPAMMARIVYNAKVLQRQPNKQCTLDQRMPR
jgi:hypothetical protein